VRPLRFRSVRRLSALLSLFTALGASPAGAAVPPGGRAIAAAARGRADQLHRREAAAADWLRRRASPAKVLPPLAMANARASWEAIGAPARPAGDPGSAWAPPPPQATWVAVGPAPLDTDTPGLTAGAGWSPAAGRVTAIAVHPSDSKTLYIGTAAGGVWKSTDAGATWVPLLDAQPSLAVGSIALDPAHPETIWVGTGSGDPYAGPAGMGLLLSKDGGATWERLGKQDLAGLSISRVVLDGDTGDVYLATLFGSAGYGDACTNTDPGTVNQGIYRSSDGGATWTLLLPGTFDDLEVDTSVMPRRLLADQAFSGALRSVDGGASWAPPVGLPAMTDRVQLTLVPSKPSIVYAGVGLQGEGSLWVSMDAGASFTMVPGIPSYCQGQCFFDNVVEVSPADADTVFLGGAVCPIWKVTGAMSGSPEAAAVSLPNQNCGPMFESWYTGFVHPDAHAMAFDPGDPQVIYAGTDGGLARSQDGGATWERLNEGVGTIQLYAVCADPSDANRIYGGAQDNGAMVRSGATAKWKGLSTGDGTGCAVDPADPKHAMVTVQYGAAFITKDGFQKSFQNTFDTQMPDCMGLPGCGDHAGFVPPVAGHPTQPNTFFIGTTRLWRSTAGGKVGSWTALGDDLTRGPGAAPCLDPDFGGEDDYLTAIGLSASDPKTMYVGSAAGGLQVTTDDGATWTPIDDAVLPPRWLSGIAVDPTNPAFVTIAFSGFSSVTPDTPGHVFRSTDGGKSWSATDIGVDLPVNQLIGHPSIRGVLYAATDFGVLVSNDAGNTWARLGQDLPGSPVYSLSFREKTMSLVAGTFGRSAWELTFVPSLGAHPDALHFESTAGDDPAPQKLSLRDEEPFGSKLSAAAKSDTPWIELESASGVAGGSLPVNVLVKVRSADMAPGDYDGSITATGSPGMPASITVPVHLHVSEKPPMMEPDGGTGTGTGSTGGGDSVLAAGGGCACAAAPGAAGRAPEWLPIALGALAAGLRRRRKSAPGHRSLAARHRPC
jgi:MYXO-CTERM domain-containing protein